MEVIKIIIKHNMGNKILRTKIHIIFAIVILFSIYNSLFSQSTNSKEENTSVLQALSMINVTIGGDFPLSGTYMAARTERVDQFVTRIFAQYKSEVLKFTPDEKLLNILSNNIDKFAKRDIILKRFNGEETKIDLVKFRLTGDFSYNPYLENDDVLIFPTLDIDRNFIDISGAVNKETKFQFVQGETLSDALQIAYGINPAYQNVDSAQISRLSYDGTEEELLNFSLKDNPILQRGDRIRILSDENKKRDYSVLVLGEVNRPGKIYITKSNTKLKDVINKAGGFTKNASLRFSNIIRDYDSYSLLERSINEEKNNFETSVLLEEQQNIISEELEFLKMFRAANLLIRDTLFFALDNKLRALSGYSDLDFRNLAVDSSYESAYLVNDKDVIIVPRERNEVYVWGGVSKIGYFPFNKNLTVSDYVKMAGGLTDIAYGEDEIFLIKAKSYDWLRVVDYDNLIIESGDYIYVKKEPPTEEFWYYLGRIGAVASILGSIATVIFVFR